MPKIPENCPRVEISYMLIDGDNRHARLFTTAARRYVEALPTEVVPTTDAKEVVGARRVTHISVGKSVLQAMSYGEVGHEADVMQGEYEAIVDKLAGQPGFAKQYESGQHLYGPLPEQELA